MRSDDRVKSDKNTADSKPKNDISADDLLKLLHESVNITTDAADKITDKKTSSTRKGDNAVRTDKSTGASAPLSIDEDIYDTAKRELYSGEDEFGDDDIDVEELIDKFIRKAKSGAAAPLPTENIVKKIEPADGITAESEAPADDIDGETVVPTDDISSETEALDDDFPDDGDEDVKLYGEAAPSRKSQEYDIIVPKLKSNTYEATPVLKESSLKKEKPKAPSESDIDDVGRITDNPYDGKTSVFDIKKVKEASDPNSEFEQVVDRALDSAATEIFTPVRDQETEVEPAADDEYTEPKAGSTTYGQPDPDEIDQTDLNLMIAFGMNDELKDKVGEQKADEIEADIEKKHEETTQLLSVVKKYEYTSRNQNTEILTRFKSQYYTLIIRIITAVVLLGATFLLENYGLFGIELPSFMNPDSYPVVYAMIDLQFIVLCGALVYRQLIDGVMNLLQLKPTPESLTAFVLILSALYTCIACILAPKQGFGLYNLPVAAAVLLALIYEFMNLKRNVFSFNVISAKKKKFVVTPVSTATESLEREIFKEYIPTDSQIIRVGKTDFVDGFFGKIGENAISKPVIGISMPVVMILAASFFILSYLKSENFYDALTLAFLTVTVTMPLTAFVIYSYPFYKAAKDSYDTDSTIVGEVSFRDYASSSVISFEDKEVFPSSGVKVTSIKVYGNNRIDEIIYNLASAFITVGGPLADVFSQATHDLGHSDNVVLEEVDDDGFTVMIDDILVNIGKASYMEKQDYDPPYDAEDKRIESNSSVGILYIAYQGRLTAKVYVQYTIDAEFEKILAQLYKTGMCVGIKSFDPNIDDLLLAKKIKAMKYPVKVIRSKTVEDIPHTSERCDSGIVSKRSVKDLLRTVALCERVNGVIKTNLIVKVLAMLIGVVVMAFIYSFGKELTISSLYITLYQLFWVIPVLIISRLSI